MATISAELTGFSKKDRLKTVSVSKMASFSLLACPFLRAMQGYALDGGCTLEVGPHINFFIIISIINFFPVTKKLSKKTAPK